MDRNAVMTTWRALLAALWLCLALPAQAGPLQILPNITAVQLGVGDSFTVFGKVTNVTGAPLQTTDLGLNFSGYPALALLTTQLLGDPDLTLPDRSTSALLALFEITVLPDAVAVAGASYGIEFFGFDFSGNFSDAATVTVTINGAVGVPEPSSLALGLTALALALRAGRRRGTTSTSMPPAHQPA